MADRYVEMKAISIDDDNVSDSSGERKVADNEGLSPVHEVLVMDLERESYYIRAWKPCKLRIHNDINGAGASLSINDDYFEDYAQTNNVPLNKCTISFITKNKGAELKLKYRENEIDLTTLFRLVIDENDSEQTVKEKVITFTLFAATLKRYGAEFDRLKAALERWDKGGRNATQSQIIHICELKYGYDSFRDRHDLEKYVSMIQNMNETVIKPLQCILKLKEFSKKEPDEWKARCIKALQIECKWKRLASQMTVELEKMRRITQLETDEMQYEQIQTILKSLNRKANIFYNEYIAPEIVSWQKIAINYRDALTNVQSGAHQWKIIVGICLGLVAIGSIVALFVATPAALLAGSATTTAITATTAYAAGFWCCVGGLGTLSVGCFGLGMKGYKEYTNPEREENELYLESERVLLLWEQFKNKYVNILAKVETVANKETGGGFEGFQAKAMQDKEKELMAKNIKEIDLLCKECIADIKKSKS